MERTFIITAGGIGKRMGSSVPKQFLKLAGQPILMHTIQRLFEFDKTAQFILTLPEEYISTWKELLVEHQFSIPHEIVVGGKERFHSIQNALKQSKGKIIAVHDGVRPFVSLETLNRLFEASKTDSAVVPTCVISESVRQLSATTNTAIDRSTIRIVQTPQVFHAAILQQAYQFVITSSPTDDATLVEQTGVAIRLVEGNDENMKITTPKDLLFAEAMIQSI